MTLIFVAAGLLYFIGFGVMCLRVKEGDYPPPPEYVDGRKGFWAGMKTFCVECFSLRFYWFMFGMTTFSAIGGSAGFMNIFWFRDVGMTLEQVGWVSGVAGVIGLCLTYPAGFVADKYHPLRVLLTMKLIGVVVYPLYLAFLLFNMPPQTAYHYYFVVSLVNLPAGILYSASAFPTEMRIFPRERFGQFCSAQAMIRSIGVIFGGIVAGVVFDLIKNHYGGSDFAYRWLPAWTLSFEVLSFLCLVNVYRGWKRYGGLTNYSPPLPEKNKENTELIGGVNESLSP
jgi:predicted MFS family arabinose efflux permease